MKQYDKNREYNYHDYLNYFSFNVSRENVSLLNKFPMDPDSELDIDVEDIELIIARMLPALYYSLTFFDSDEITEEIKDVLGYRMELA